MNISHSRMILNKYTEFTWLFIENLWIFREFEDTQRIRGYSKNSKILRIRGYLENSKIFREFADIQRIRRYSENSRIFREFKILREFADIRGIFKDTQRIRGYSDMRVFRESHNIHTDILDIILVTEYLPLIEPSF
ncbi:12968_t:CDS:2 [Cetraspora pellucida]|uniref:12968_t:CDS:1 n=1 Tax=Cetraspora pellucida TaxID=1433469 RepID=A0A9N9ECD2_9GLOM|nr:12968_t:CDS:2 [Cetraspora pellucida]